MTLDFNIIVIIIVIFAVGILSGTLWIFFKGVLLILKLFYYIGVAAIWLFTLPFRRGE
jgi:hypothetical protein